MTARATRLLLALLATLTLLAGCGGSGGGDGNDGGNTPDPINVKVTVSPSAVTVAPSGTRTFGAVVSGTTDTRVTWSATGGTITSAGVYTAPTTTGSYTVRATSVADTGKSAVAGVTVRTGVTQAITVTPPNASLAAGGTQQFMATATGFSNPAVVWTTTGGTVTSTGLYTAPSTGGTFVVRATSVQDPSIGGEARVTVSNRLTISPAILRVGTGETTRFTASLPTGTADVIWTASAGTITSDGRFTAPGAGTSVTITATLRSDPSIRATLTLTISAITVAISPTTATVERGATFDFDATVTGATTSSAVTWTASVGTINSSGLFTAPSTGTTATIRATSVANPAVSATATVTLTAALPNVVVTVAPTGIQLAPGGTYDFGVTVTGSTNTTVAWSSTGGSIDANGLLTAGPTTGTFEVRATSNANPNRSGVVAVKIDAIPVNVTPRSSTVTSGQNIQFAATVGGTGAAGGVTWTTTGGSINTDGLFSATTRGTFTVTATSKTDTTKSNTATVVVN